ncbi:CatB-related O-acetyltransferase [Kingella negevensis]|uniref:CatB-related O-acetyltransferase n=1 Tax=Kingella negevensis TaxID=1522312 RepID=UPI000694B08B|nr:CatB-related O-acetyltransferase [Kingella negevensis]MDK4687885.1 CatB-related O-acetyltransferase [Kingella negevensis]WII91123.1 CatB-related O-acetyltransferase [Kingella negevensis]WII93034.1 CatB-related O-acetyltransferase [Kingella negevensis]
MDFAGQYCVFSWEDGSYKRFFRLLENGAIQDLFGSQGHDNERFWAVDGEYLVLLSLNRNVTSRFVVQEQTRHSTILAGEVWGGNIRLRIECFPNKSDLFEYKTQFTHAEIVEQGWLEVGAHTYGKPIFVDLYYSSKVKIGDYCSIAGNVKFINANHRIDLVSTYPFYSLRWFYQENTSVYDHFAKGAITVGNDVWIGENAVILSGVTIGDGAIIAANSLVNKDVEPYSIVGGNPAKHIRFRIEDAEQREQMQKIAWWNWSEEKIIENMEWIMSPDIAAFIQKFQAA